jgi:maltose O-acetyltransferase
MKNKINFVVDRLVDLFIPNYLFERLINAYHRKRARSMLARLKSTGSNIQLHRNITIHNPEKVEIGDDVSMGDRLTILAFGGVKIGSRVMLSHDVSIITTTHNHTSHVMVNEILYNSVEIGNDVWIGAKATIMPGVRIGDGVVIGAASVVTHSIPNNAIAFGVPAKIMIADRHCHTLRADYKSFKYQFSTLE